ncbi:kinase-like domain-containing protein [Rhizophagus irregularis DAOM 181602=DAOM 197198]|nr:kinase-like domain-containing protein [Rhizophagus irregularis DAOM 181602=DAOM 197198]
MDEIKLSDDVFEQIKDFRYWYLTKEQESLIDKLITDEELKERYKKNGLCNKCKQPNTNYPYCQPCNSKSFQQNFKNWTSGNHSVDEFIQKAQLEANDVHQILEWIEYDEFEGVEYLAKGGFGTTFKAVWEYGPINWDFEKNQLVRSGETEVALKCLYNSQDITKDFLNEVESNILVCDSDSVVRCFDPLKRPSAIELRELTREFFYDTIETSEIFKQIREADIINEKLSFSSPLISTVPKNANYNDDLLGIEYSDSLRMDFTELDINSKHERN